MKSLGASKTYVNMLVDQEVLKEVWVGNLIRYVVNVEALSSISAVVSDDMYDKLTDIDYLADTRRKLGISNPSTPERRAHLQALRKARRAKAKENKLRLLAEKKDSELPLSDILIPTKKGW